VRVRYDLGRLDQWMGRTSSAPRLLDGALRHGSVRGRCARGAQGGQPPLTGGARVGHAPGDEHAPHTTVPHDFPT